MNRLLQKGHTGGKQRYALSFVIRELQTETTVRYCHTSIRTVAHKSKTTGNYSSADLDVKRLELLSIPDGMQMLQLFWKNSLAISQKVKHILIICHWDFNSRCLLGQKLYSYKNLSRNVCKWTYLSLTQSGNNPNILQQISGQANRGESIQWNTNNPILVLIKRSKLPIHVAASMRLKGRMLRRKARLSRLRTVRFHLCGTLEKVEPEQ